MLEILVQIIWVNVLPSGDNAVVIALAASYLPEPQRNRAVILGSQLLLKAMQRHPIFPTLGAALLGFVAGGLLVHDPAVDNFLIGLGGATATIVELAGAIGVVLVGCRLARRRGHKIAGDESARASP